MFLVCKNRLWTSPWIDATHYSPQNCEDLTRILMSNMIHLKCCRLNTHKGGNNAYNFSVHTHTNTTPYTHSLCHSYTNILAFPCFRKHYKIREYYNKNTPVLSCLKSDFTSSKGSTVKCHPFDWHL